MNATIKQILDSAKRSIENVTGAEIISIKYKAKYSSAQIDRLKSAVCKAYNIRIIDLMRKRRDQELVRPRQMFYYIATVKFGMKLVDAGSVFGQDHTTAVHNRDKVKDLLSINDQETHSKLELINEYLNE